MKDNQVKDEQLSVEPAGDADIVVYDEQSSGQVITAKPVPIDKKAIMSIPRLDKKSERRKKKGGPSREQIEQIVMEEWMDVLSELEVRMLRGVFALDRTCVREIMIPLSEILAVNVNTPTEQLKEIVRDTDFSFIPVFKARIDRLTGIVSIMDILYAPEESDNLTSFMREAYYIPETKVISELLEELREAEEPIALVIDEHGSCVGLATLEDILEQIVGDIGFNAAGRGHHIESTGANSWVIDAKVDIDVVNRELELNIPKDRCDTIGGFLLKQFGRLPEQDMKLEYQGKEFLIAEVFDYGISEIHVNDIVKPVDFSKRKMSFLRKKSEV